MKDENRKPTQEEIDRLLEEAAPNGKTGHKKTDRENRKNRTRYFKKLMKVLSGELPPVFPGEDD